MVDRYACSVVLRRMRVPVFIFCLVIFIFFGCSHEPTTYPNVKIKKMPVSVVLPVSLKWLREKGYIFQYNAPLDSAHWSFEWGKSFINIIAYRDTTPSPILSWIPHPREERTHYELTFYPSTDSVEITFSGFGEENMKNYLRLQLQLKELADTLNKFNH